MTRRAIPALVALAAASAVLVVGAAAPALAVEPGDGAVLFNQDGTPIGSELLYGDLDEPQYLFTAETGDDDYWGLDADGVPANDYVQFGLVTSGIPLGFTISMAGSDYDGVVVGENGTVCLVSSTDPASDVTHEDFECSFYNSPAAYLVDPDTHADGRTSATFTVFGNDVYVGDDQPIDTDDDSVNDGCRNGGFYFDDEDVCSSIFWGTTTYEGKQAFVVTWYHNPDISYDGDEGVATTSQLLLVDDGSGDITVVYNYDQVEGEGFQLDWWVEDEGCLADYENGDEEFYTYIGAAGLTQSDPIVTTALDLFGPECMNGLDPTPSSALVDGGSNALIDNRLNSNVDGRYIFRLVDGLLTTDVTVVPDTEPEPAEVLPATGVESGIALLSALLLVVAGAAMAATRRVAARTGI